MSCWGIYYGCLATFMLLLEFRLLWRNWHHLDKYHKLKIFSITMTPLVFLLITWFFIESFLILIKNSNFAPIWLTRVMSLLVLGVYFLVFLLIIPTYGQGWLLRRKYTCNLYFGPYILYGSKPQTQIHILWGCPKLLQKKYSKEILFGLNKTDIKPFGTNFSSYKYWQHVKLTNLQPDKKYFYKIPTKSNIYHFFTAPERSHSIKESETNKFNFAVVSDLHGSSNDISNSVNLIKNMIPKSRFLVSAGDNVTDSRLKIQWRTFWGQMETISPYVPLITSTGNHDGETRGMAKIWKYIFPYDYENPENGLYYSFIYLNTAFFVLDLYNAGTSDPIPSDTQVEWLTSKLESLPKTIFHRILVLHNAIYCSGDFGSNVSLEKVLLPIIERFHIQIVISGHAHMFEAFYRNDVNAPEGTIFLVTGGGGGRLDTMIMNEHSDVPYLWEDLIHIAKKKPFLGGDKKNPLRNDYAILNYQELGKIGYHILNIEIDGRKITVKAIEWDKNVLYEKSVHSVL